MSLKSRIPAIIAGLPAAQRRGLERSALFVADVATQLVPRDTTALARTIRVEDGADDRTIRVIAGDPSATNPKSGGPVDYAAHIEYGTASSPAQPFMTPAAQAIKPGKEIAAEIKALVRGSL